MIFKVIRGQGQSEEMTSVPYRDYFLVHVLLGSVHITRSAACKPVGVALLGSVAAACMRASFFYTRSMVDYDYVTQRCDVTEAIATRSVTYSSWKIGGHEIVFSASFASSRPQFIRRSLSQSVYKFNRRGLSARDVHFSRTFSRRKNRYSVHQIQLVVRKTEQQQEDEFYAPGT